MQLMQDLAARHDTQRRALVKKEKPVKLVRRTTALVAGSKNA